MGLVWLGVTLITFIVANVIPRDPVALRLGPKATPEAIAQFRHELGLDQPLPQQYLRYLSDLFQGNLGTSIWSGRPITKDLNDYLPATLELALTSLVLSIVLGIPLGILAASRADGIIDRLVQMLATFGLAVPLFWLGLVFQIFFYRDLNILPLDSRIDLVLGAPERITGLYVMDSVLHADWQRLGNSLQHLILPVVTLSLPPLGAIARMTRASIMEVTGKDFVRMARAKGATGAYVMRRHILRNALLPVVTLAGNLFNALLAGVFVVESIFNWPGLGWYATKVILASDYLAIVSITLIIAILCTTVNLIVDLAYSAVDPRIQLT